MSAPLPSNDLGADKRRTTRVMQAVVITVRGADALGQPFEETTSTVMVNCNGCKYRSKHYVPKGSQITIEISRRERGLPSRVVPAHVVWVQRPRTFREIFHVALAFEIPGNVWDVAAPPDDWFPHPDDEELIIPVPPGAAEPDPLTVLASEFLAQESEAATHIPATPAEILNAAAEATALSTNPRTLVMPASSREHESELEAARQMVKSVVEAAMSQEIAALRQRLESHFQESLQETIKSVAEHIAEDVLIDVVQRATERTAAIVAEARITSEANAEELDARIRVALREALDAGPGSPRKSPSGKRRRNSSKQGGSIPE
ncbi:MAG: hypothetical protein WA755_08245 [Candidatus Acidiferrales bacterium]